MKIRRSIRLLLLSGALAALSVAAAETRTASVAVEKKMSSLAGSKGSPFLTVRTMSPQRLGFTEVADYVDRTLFEGPADKSGALVQRLRGEGYVATIARDLGEVRFRGTRLDPDADACSDVPSPCLADRTANALWIMTLRGYPTSAWLAELEARALILAAPIPPASYLVYASPHEVQRLRQEVPFVRGFTKVTREMRLAELPPQNESPFLRVFIDCVEGSSLPSLQSRVESLSIEPVSKSTGSATLTSYTATLKRSDIAELLEDERVVLIGPLPQGAVSSERQGVLILAPQVDSVTGRLSLPDALSQYSVSDYSCAIRRLLRRDCNEPLASPFDSTRDVVGIIDTGFDNGGWPADVPADLANTNIVKMTTRFHDADGLPIYVTTDEHGTLTADVIGGYSSVSTRVDSQGFRLGLGVAPMLPLAIDHFNGARQCRLHSGGGGPTPDSGSEGQDDLVRAFDRLQNNPPQEVVPRIINLSYNDINFNNQRTGECGYNYHSKAVDDATRTRGWLFLVSAGNVSDQTSCPLPRAPATAKNAIAVGATMGYGLEPGAAGASATTCSWNDSQGPIPLDGRNVASFSPPRDPGSMLKPDLVAPGVRITGPRSRPGYFDQLLDFFARTRERVFTPCLSIFCDSSDSVSGAVSYNTAAGTSFAAPAVTAIAAIARKWRRDLNNDTDPSPAMIKAMLINGARDLAGGHVVDPHGSSSIVLQHIYEDPYQGWGMVSLERLLGPACHYFFQDQSPSVQLGGPGQPNDWSADLVINDRTRPVRLTLVWSDPSGATPIASEGAQYGAINHLALSALEPGSDPSAYTWWGNHLSGGVSYRGGSPVSSADNVQQIIVPPNIFATDGAALRVTVTNLQFVTAPAGLTGQDFVVFAENAHRTPLPTDRPCVILARPAKVTSRAATATGGSRIPATVDLSDPAPEGGALVSLSTDKSAATMPANVWIAPGLYSADTVVTTFPVSTNTLVTLQAAYNGGTATATITVTPSSSSPLITGLAPNAGSVVGGNQVTIYGNNLTGTSGVTFGTFAPVPPQSVTSTSVTAIVPQWPYGSSGAPVPVDVSVTTPNGTATATNGYTYYYPPELRSISPTSGSTTGGDTVIIGAQFILTGTYLVTIGGVPASFTISANTITAMTPPHASGPVDVVVTNPGGSGRLIGQYTYIAAPTIATLSPNAGPIAGNQTVMISGANLSGGTAIFGGSTATTISNNGSEMIVTTPAHAAGAVNVVVTTAAGLVTVTNGYSYVNPPTIASVGPNAGPTAGGQSVTITGTNLSGGSVTFGGTMATVTGNLGTSITATTPAHAVGLVNVVVTTSGGIATLTNGYTFNAPPTLTAVSPNTGSTGGGQPITITGTSLSGVSVTFGGLTATVTAPGTTQITVTSPAHAAGAISVVVTNQWGSAQLANGFTYYAPPTITSVNPNVGPAAGGQNVTITGTNLTEATATFGGVDAEVTSTSATQMTVTTPAHQQGSLDVGVDVVVTNPSSVSAVLSLGYIYSGGPTCAPPDATITTPAQVCACLAPLTASVPRGQEGLTYVWSITGGTIDFGQGTRAITWTPTIIGTVTFNVTLTRSWGCSSSGTATSRALGPVACQYVCHPPPPSPGGGD